MNPPSDHDVITAMRWYGGSFVRALAEAAACADENNMRRIKEAWPEYWLRYSEMAASEISQNKPTTEPNPCLT